MTRKHRRAAIRLEDLSENERGEVERFCHYIRLCSQAQEAGASRVEAELAIYPDLYPEKDKRA